eukprot:TRINITY_DN3699_c0_g1_i1.p2 TRINITY_DN3699_c0_g1~~TRINITY_DN3699_c0_g1_i1.p2  ORF type:complete len:176 (+),score=39.69 TRINITY_DN3699_c0_g1_i1:497-1024(+)
MEFKNPEFLKPKQKMFATRTASVTRNSYIKHQRQSPVRVQQRYRSTPSADVHRLEKDGESLFVTDKCIQTIKKLQSKDSVKDKAKMKLRLAIEGGGCSGMQYNFTIDEEPLAEDDLVFQPENTNARIVVDRESLKHVKGSTVDFEEEMIRTSFVVKNNPQAEQSCGCKVSFSSKA